MGKIYPDKMYHGTDYKVLMMSKEERDNLENACLIVSKVCFDKLSGIESISKSSSCPNEYKELINDIWSTLKDRGFNPFQSRNNNVGLYDYEDFYVTNDYDRAKRYANNNFVYGEQGYSAYLLYEVATKITNIKNEIPSEYKDAFTIFEKQLARDRNPVIVELVDLDEDDLYWENGKIFNWDALEKSVLRGSIISFRMKKRKIDLEKDKIIKLYED